MTLSWSNWSGNVTSTPRTIATPSTEGELQMLVREANHAQRSIRVVGTGHSFMPLCATDDLLISLDNMQGLIYASAEQQKATFWAGTKLHAIGDPLWEHGLAMINMGDIDRQSLGGAIGTGTHGTGPTLGNLSTQVVALRLLTAQGDLIDCSAEIEPMLFKAACLSLGALGIITQVTLRCLPAYELHEQSWVVGFDECMATLDQQIAATRHFEFFWVPGEDRCAMKALSPTPLASSTPFKPPQGRLARYIRAPRRDRAYRIFPSERNNRFNESEFALPAANGPSCLREIRALMQSRYSGVAWPIEYRTLAADDIP
ncbi:MAG: FAD-binding protein, partial [Caldilineaceae bacterium]|nr:FAD-binding protein [Caldilineaceae bacterium]